MTKRTAGRVQGGQRPREAIDWFVEHESAPERERSRRVQWADWAASPENRADYAEIIRVHLEASTLPGPRLPSREELLEDLCDDPYVVAIRPPRAGAIWRLVGNPRSLPARNRIAVAATWVSWAALLVAAALVGVIAVVLFIFRSYSSPHPLIPAERSYASAPGEQRAFALQDGSRITLGGDTALVVRFSAGARQIELTRGEALFQVAHDPRRPFVVHAAGGTTTAVGTAFEIRLYAHHAQVWVREGAVEVAPLREVAIDDSALPDVARWIPVRLARGEEMVYDAQGEASAPKAADPRLSAAWTEGTLVPLIYHGRLLPEVIEDVQRYSRRRILLDPAAGDLRFSGIVIQGDVEAWVRELPMIYPVEVIDCRESQTHAPECSDPERIYIRSRMGPRTDGPESVHR
jgi:transmembrane sensor